MLDVFPENPASPTLYLIEITGPALGASARCTWCPISQATSRSTRNDFSDHVIDILCLFCSPIFSDWQYSAPVISSVRRSRHAGTTARLVRAELRGVMRDMIQFNALGYLAEVSRREVINRYYRLVQEGLQVDRTWRLTSEAIANLDAVCRTAHQEEQLRRTVETLDQQKDVLEESKELHAKVEWVEVFIVAVYFAELIHIVGYALPFQHSFVGWSALICSFGAMTTALVVLRPWRSLRLRGLWTLLLVGLLTITAFLALGYTRYRSSESEQINTHSQPQQMHQQDSDEQATPQAQGESPGH